MTTLPSPEELSLVLDQGPSKRRRRRWLIGSGIALVVAVAVVATVSSLRHAPVAWRTDRVVREDLQVVVTAVGTVAPREVVDVGSEQSGIVDDVYVDENDTVAAGQPLAELDTSVLSLQQREASAQVAALAASWSQARVVEQKSGVDLKHAETLLASGAISQDQADQTRATHDQAVAALSAAAQQLQAARARLGVAGTQLHKAVIRSPIDGVVLARNVDPGQSVVAAFQAVTLFQVAADLRQLQVDVDVDEADVPRVKPGLKATFTVAAWADREFPAVVTKVHVAPKTEAGVVTYRAELYAENPEGALLPGMTATARIAAESHPGSLTVPLAALRFAPEKLPENLAEPGPGEGRIWRLEDDTPKPVIVKLGPTDGVRQAVEGDVAEDEVVVVGRAETEK